VAIFLHVFLTIDFAEIRQPSRRLITTLITISRLSVIIVPTLKICWVFSLLTAVLF
jgi:hypothetical protein